MNKKDVEFLKELCRRGIEKCDFELKKAVQSKDTNKKIRKKYNLD